MATIIVLSVVVLAVGAGAGSYYYSRKKRTGAFEHMAGLLNVEFRPEGDENLAVELKKFHLFNIGCHQKVVNVLRGNRDGIDVSIFDFSYEASSSRRRVKELAAWQIESSLHHRSIELVYTQTVLCLKSRGFALPSFSLRPKKIEHGFGEQIVAQDQLWPFIEQGLDIMRLLAVNT